MSTNNAKLGEYFLRIPKCEGDGTHWSIYKGRFTYAADAAGLAEHLEDTHLPPVPPTPPTNSPPTQAELDAIDAYEKNQKAYKSGQAVVKQAIASTIPDALFLRFKDTKHASDLWKKISEEFERKSKMVTVDL
ncbi:hypothetical protein C8J57DRAFT_1059483, partial [Mycena rebaudengoi]